MNECGFFSTPCLTCHAQNWREIWNDSLISIAFEMSILPSAFSGVVQFGERRVAGAGVVPAVRAFQRDAVEALDHRHRPVRLKLVQPDAERRAMMPPPTSRTSTFFVSAACADDVATHSASADSITRNVLITADPFFNLNASVCCRPARVSIAVKHGSGDPDTRIRNSGSTPQAVALRTRSRREGHLRIGCLRAGKRLRQWRTTRPPCGKPERKTLQAAWKEAARDAFCGGGVARARNVTELVLCHKRKSRCFVGFCVSGFPE